MEILLLLVGFAVAYVIYFFPLFIAKRNNHPDTASIFVVNLFLGWSLIGWAVALAWAVKEPNA